MSVDLASIDEALERLRGDQVAVARGMLAARDWADVGRLSAIDEALEALSAGEAVQPGSAAASPSAPPEPPAAASESESGGGLDGLFDELEGMEDPFASDADRAETITGEEDDDLLEIDELEILEDDDLLSVD